MSLLNHILGPRDTEPWLEPYEQVAPTTSNSVAWIVVTVVISIIILGATFTVLVIFYARRRQYRREQELHPYLSRDEYFRRQKLSAADLFREEEEQRMYMIRKSLATRSTNSSRSEFPQAVDQLDRELTEMERQESTRLKDDWKRWEARERHERSTSGGQHPAASPASGVPILRIPSPAKHRSQGRISHSNPPPSPPVPPRHPGRRSSG